LVGAAAGLVGAGMAVGCAQACTAAARTVNADAFKKLRRVILVAIRLSPLKNLMTVSDKPTS
jgi:hypothetical protein